MYNFDTEKFERSYNKSIHTDYRKKNKLFFIFNAPQKLFSMVLTFSSPEPFFPAGLVENWLHIYQRKYAILNYAQTDVVFHNNDLRWRFIFLLCTSQKKHDMHSFSRHFCQWKTTSLSTYMNTYVASCTLSLFAKWWGVNTLKLSSRTRFIPVNVIVNVQPHCNGHFCCWRELASPAAEV